MIDYLIKAHDSREKTNVKMLCLYKQNMQPTIMSSLYLLLNHMLLYLFHIQFVPLCTAADNTVRICMTVGNNGMLRATRETGQSVMCQLHKEDRLHVELQNCLSCLGCALRQTACYSYISLCFPICITVNRLLALFNCSRLLSSFSIVGLARTWNMIQRERAAPVLRLSGRMMQLNEGCTQGQQLSHVK